MVTRENFEGSHVRNKPGLLVHLVYLVCSACFVCLVEQN